MFSRWGAFVYRLRRPVVVARPSLLAVALRRPRQRRPHRPVRRRLARRGLRIGRRSPTASPSRVRCGPERGDRPLPVGDAWRRRDLGRSSRPRSRHDRRTRHRPTRTSTAIIGYAETGDTALHQHRRRRRLRRRRARRHRRRLGRRSSTRFGRRLKPPAGYTSPLDRLRRRSPRTRPTSPRRTSSVPSPCRCPSPRSSSCSSSPRSSPRACRCSSPGSRSRRPSA